MTVRFQPQISDMHDIHGAVLRDIVKQNLAHSNSAVSKGARFLTVLACASVILLCAASATLALWYHPVCWVLVAVPLLIGYCVARAYFGDGVKNAAMKKLLDDPYFGDECIMSLDTDILHLRSLHAEYKIEFGGILNVVETRSVVLLHTKPLLFLIPVRAFESAAQREAFCRIVRREPN